MTEEEFIIKRDKLIEEIRSSELYQEFKKIDKELYVDENVCSLTREKEKLIQDYKFAKEEEEKDNMLKSIVAKQKEIDELPIVKKYYELKKQLKDLVKPLEKGIIEKLYL